MDFAITTTNIGAHAVQTVNAREVHAKLEVSKDFNGWVKAQIKRARLVDGRDYVTAENLSTPSGGSAMARQQRIIDYHLTIEAAKHIGMLSGTDKGFEVREYFLECERKSKAPSLPVSLTPAEMLLAMAQQHVDAERRVAVVETRMLAIEDKFTVREKAQTVLEFSISLGLETDKASLLALGKSASKISRLRGIEITTKHQDHPGFRGNVNAYHPDALFAAMEESEMV
jgi:phage anti-repressor protein